MAPEFSEGITGPNASRETQVSQYDILDKIVQTISKDGCNIAEEAFWKPVFVDCDTISRV